MKPMAPLPDLPRCAYTLFLFTKSDFKTIFVPVVAFALVASFAASGKLEFYRVIQTIIWVWLYLLQFCASNQILGVAEDFQNKPWRPIPAGYITVAQASLLRWVLAPMCLLLSILFGVAQPGLMLTMGIFINNEMAFDRHWFTRNIANSLGYFAFESGASIIMLGTLNDSVRAALTGSTFIILTTIHAQDFRDVAGDTVQGRRTLPIVAPEYSRLSMILVLVAWPLLLCRPYHLSGIATFAHVILGSIVGGRFIRLRSVQQDDFSYLLYNNKICTRVGAVPIRDKIFSD
ncbi:hypothetical protein C8R46DRAFT_1203796 [Mycena filopes]|nr:hypothetical protein C8R46DRAFT_1203796 [Mycena filopes]